MSNVDSNKELELFNVDEVIDYRDHLFSLLYAARCEVSNILPVEWVEQNVVMTSAMSSVTGMFSYFNTPYTRELVNFWSQSDPSEFMACIKSAQSAFTSSVVLNGLMWMIPNDPGNAMLLVGHKDLLKSAVNDLDMWIDNAGNRPLIQSSIKRARNTKTGDTDSMKEYPGGSLILGLTNPDSLRQVSIRYMIVDDFDAMKSDTEKDGDMLSIIMKRTNAFKNNRKVAVVSTPTLKGKSNIEKAYKLGDQRKFHIPAPCCGEFISLEWENMTWELDENDELIPDSVGYRCQSCSEVFDDSQKMMWLNDGKWVPTAKPKKPGYKSYLIDGMIAPYFMDGWLEFVYQWLDIENEDNVQVRIAKKKAFYNLVLGRAFEYETNRTSSLQIQQNMRRYEIGTIPEKQSIKDGNGKIVLIVCSMDLNGMMKGLSKNMTRNDVRIDYEIVAYAEGGQSYSIDHGSLGTFFRGDKNPDEREWWTYEHGQENSVWKLVEELMQRKYVNDNTGKEWKVGMYGIDSGYFTDYAYTFADSHKNVRILKGKDDEEKAIDIFSDRRTFVRSKSKANLYLIENNYTKDIVASHMGLLWNEEVNTVQPFGFMNFPIPSGGKYTYKDFFKHFEGEHKVIEKNKYRWVKRKSKSENHFWDTRVYAEALKDIFVYEILKAVGVTNPTWDDFIKAVRKR